MFRVSAIAAVFALGLAAAHAQAPPPQLGQAAIPPPHQAQPGEGCFNRQEQRGFVLAGRAIRLGFALRAIRAQDGDELVRAELCRSPARIPRYGGTWTGETTTSTTRSVDDRNRRPSRHHVSGRRQERVWSVGSNSSNSGASIVWLPG